ncbi:hypothetical protein BVG16_02935 [Paenibacillus selenitireducens]|uniref:N-acetyltransferase domain-containing protein n=1 Tax=Paenibacillus selenitireducens TaxID=1324314 RepID=A0A1T2XN47_9BACL|nr:GNAT family N-acetyltransferase [Paenibacillus selenitireducens]OPA81287.1 hypothetical protein BVG16_02935 [Paenibacillus selenitireducens]
MIRLIEERSFNAWPALQTIIYDGWMLHFARGYSKRANSIKPLYASSIDIHEKIARCEQLYESQQLDVIFKVIPELHGPELDHILASRGYRFADEVSMQIADLRTLLDASGPRSVNHTDKANDEWISAYCRLSHQISERARETMTAMLSSIVPKTCFASIEVDGQPLACGFGVCEGNTVGLFDIVTDTDRRRQGYGEALVRYLMQWGKTQGAAYAYLQVVASNVPAVSLYHKLGFRESHRHWYRIR